MSEEKKPVEPASNTAKPASEAAKPTKEAAKPAKKSWSNPALRAMGIPKISLPSRNWMIFWSVLATIGGGIYYDRHQQKKIREKYTEQVKVLGEEVYTSNRIPRKVTVFIAPPPDAFLEESLKHFRRYVKPLLNAAAIDFDVYTEGRQGEIRSQIADRIREIRRKALEDQKKKEEDARAEAYSKSWTKFFKEDVPNVFKRAKEEEPEVLVDRHDLYSPTNVLGLYKIFEPLQPIRDDETDVETVGGIICIGRGAYKEYVSGVQEGLLGPLDKPEEKIEEVKIESVEGSEESSETKQEVEIDDFGLKDEGDKPKQDPVPQPYIKQRDYQSAVLAPELDMSTVIRDINNVPVMFEQPLYVYPIPKLVGISNWPRKIYRFFTRRDIAEDVTSETLAIVYGKSRPFEYKDNFLAKEEELNWPKKWVERGRKKESEWVQEVEIDNRIADRLRVFEQTK